MNILNDISDEEFVPFLHNLGVETYGKSFEWMLNDPDFADVLHWIYNNLDENNALSAREEYRITEIEKKGRLLSPQDLDAKVASIQTDFTDLCLPGEQELLEDIKLDVNMQKEQLNMLQKHEEILKELVEQIEATKEELSLEISKLNIAHQQCADEERSAGEECVKLAEEVENITSEVMDIIANALEVYGKCAHEKDVAKRFFTFGPFESYRQSQELFKSHFDLYATKKFNNRKNNCIPDEDLQSALIEAKNMEERLSDAVCAYIETKAELQGEQAKLGLICNYNNSIHPSQIPVLLMEAQSAVQLLEQEESILDQQLQSAVKCFVERRTARAVETTARSALAVREQIYKDLNFLHEVTQQALTADRILYCALRWELRSIEELMNFAAHLRLYVMEEGEVVSSRIKSMAEICNEQEIAERNLQTSDILLSTLIHILGGDDSSDVLLPIKLYNELRSSVHNLKENINEGYRLKQEALLDMQQCSQPLRAYIYDGSTRQPNCYHRDVSAMSHALAQEMQDTDAKVITTSNLFSTVKSGDKHHIRKLWQWFLTDPAKLLAAVKNVQHL